MTAIGAMAMPADFRYMDVYRKGKPAHSEEDRFRVRHPVMPAGKRAKIFAPFDALRGFDAAILATDLRQAEEWGTRQESGEELERRLGILRDLTSGPRGSRKPAVTVTCLMPQSEEDDDPARGGRGRLRVYRGICGGIDPNTGRALLVDRIRIPVDRICSIESEEEIFGEE